MKIITSKSSYIEIEHYEKHIQVTLRFDESEISVPLTYIEAKQLVHYIEGGE